MSMWYELSGDVTVRDEEPAREIIKLIEDVYVGDEFDLDADDVDGGILVTVKAGGACGAGTIDAVEDLLKRLTPYAVEAGRFKTGCDGEPGHFWVGGEDAVRQAKQSRKVDKARMALDALDADTREELIQSYVTAAAWRK